MHSIDRIKNRLITDLWLPVAKKGGDLFYPRLRINKNMKILTLTNDNNYQEIDKFVINNLTQRNKITAWNRSHLKRLRLEPDIAPANVLGASKYEDAISSSTFVLSNHFPYDVINLDFSSQDPLFEMGRVEKEVISVEKTINLQKNSRYNNLILIYTTILNSKDISLQSICQESDMMHFEGWRGPLINEYPSSISENNQKIHYIEHIISKISEKYNYHGRFQKIKFNYQKNKIVYSITCTLTSGE